eukprot:Skav201612  [mRNA]  locus=scaffold152:1071978:1078365:+ [translate_table: standard]
MLRPYTAALVLVMGVHGQEISVVKWLGGHQGRPEGVQVCAERPRSEACGGGLRKAGEFRYYSEPLLVGDDAGLIKGYPLPRTATRYSVDSSCGLLDLNLTIDGTTGELRLVPGCSSVGCGAPTHLGGCWGRIG